MSTPLPHPSPLHPSFQRLFDLAPLPLLQKAVQRDVVALFYHAVGGQPLPHVTPLYACKSADEFEQDLLYLKANHPLVSHDDIVAARERGRPLPPRAVALSFDDGFAECYSVARPLLLKHGVPCTFFVIEEVIGNRRMMHRNKVALCLERLDREAGDAQSLIEDVAAHCGRRRFAARTELRAWIAGLRYRDRKTIDELCEALGVDVDAFLRERRPYLSEQELAVMVAEGFAIGAHTLDHPELDDLPWDGARRQIAASCERMRERTGRERGPFAFPFNGLRLARDDLAQLHDELGSIDLMYDTNNLMKDRDFIVNRVWCDSPAGASGADSNLPALLRRAHALEPLRAVKRRFARSH